MRTGEAGHRTTLPTAPPPKTHTPTATLSYRLDAHPLPKLGRCRIVETVRGSLATPDGAVAKESADVAADGRAARAGLSGGGELAAPPRRQLGTMLPLEADRLFDSLWQPLLHVTPINQLHRPLSSEVDDDPAPRGSEESELPARWRHLQQHARRLEIFLDHGAAVHTPGLPTTPPCAEASLNPPHSTLPTTARRHRRSPARAHLSVRLG